MQKLQIVILAAGIGKRMGNKNLPKVLLPFKGKPIIKHLADEVKKSRLSEQPVIVVGQKKEIIKKTLGSKYTYLFQREQLGTGHAVLICKNTLKDKYKNIMVLYGDHPLLRANSIKKIARRHFKSDSPLTMAVVNLPNFRGWRKAFCNWGRIIKDKKGNIIKSIEFKDASPNQRKIKLVNPSFFCFKADWLWENIDSINNKNVQGEYYLTDLVQIVSLQKEKINSVEIEPREALGVNTPEELKIISRL